MATTLWSSHTALLCNANPGYGSAVHTTAIVDTTGTLLAIFSYDAPVVTSLPCQNLPSSSGSSITIIGTNFGFEDATPLGRIGGTRCATTSWLSESTLVCRSNDGRSSNLGLVVTIAGPIGTTNRQFWFTYDAPVVTSLAPTNAALSGGGAIQISGVNMNADDSSPTVWVGISKCPTVSWYSATSLQCLVERGFGRRFSILAECGSLAGTALLLFTYDAPVLTSLRSRNAPSSGEGSITILGTNYFLEDLTATAILGSSACISSSWTSGTLVKCRPNQGEGRGQTVQLAAAGLVSSLFQGFSYDSPALTYVHRFNLPSSMSLSLSITGMNLGVLDLSATILFGTTVCNTISWTTQTTLLCMPGLGSGSISLIGFVGSLVGSTVSIFTYDGPVSTISFPSNGPQASRTSLTILGTNFGLRDRSSTVFVLLTYSC